MDAKTTPSILTSLTEKFQEFDGFRWDAEAIALSEAKQGFLPDVRQARTVRRGVKDFFTRHGHELTALEDLLASSSVTRWLPGDGVLHSAVHVLRGTLAELRQIRESVTATLRQQATAVEQAGDAEALADAGEALRIHLRGHGGTLPALDRLLARAQAEATRVERRLAFLKTAPTIAADPRPSRRANAVEWPPARPEIQTKAVTDFDVFATGGGGGQR